MLKPLIPIVRLVRHRFAPDSRRLVSDRTMQNLAALVATGERLHSGEIRICIESRLPNSYLLRPEAIQAVTRCRAVAQFSKLRVWDTEHNNGVLIYLLFAERDVEIVADRGFNKCITPEQWEAICRPMEARFVKGEFEAGLTEGINTIGDLLREHFPADMGGNEQPDRPMIV